MKQMLSVLSPLLVSGLFQQLYNMLDGMIIGRYLGPGAQAVISSSASNMINIFNNLSAGMCVGALIRISQTYGGGNYRKAREYVKNAMILIALVDVLLALVYCVYGREILVFLNTPAELQEASYSYLRGYSMGFIPYSFFMLLNSAMRGLGESRRPSFMLMLNYGINIALDVLFIVAFKRGTDSLPLIYVCTYLCSCLLSARLMQADYRIFDREYRISLKNMVSIITVGVPSTLISLSYALSTTVLQMKMNTFGAAVLAANNVTGRVDGLMWIVMSALSTSLVTLTSRYCGAGDYDKIRKLVRSGLLFAFGFTAAFYLAVTIAKPLLLSMFTADMEVRSLAERILSQMMLFLFVYPFLEVYSSVLKGTGHTLIPTCITLVCVCGIRFIAVFVFGEYIQSVFQLNYAYPIVWGATAIALIIRYCLVMRNPEISLRTKEI